MRRAKNVSKMRELKFTFKSCRINMIKLIRLNKANHYENCFKEKKLILYKTWQGIGEIINTTKKTNKERNCLKSKQRNINKLRGTANTINVQFSSIAEQTEKKFTHNPNPNAFFIIPTRAKKASSIIKYFHSRKSYDPNNFPVKILKTIKKEISEPLSKLINLNFPNEHYTDALKTANNAN